MKVTVVLGKKGNNFILNGKHKDLNAEEVVRGMTVPIFGKGVIYDCPNEKLMDQKRCLTYEQLVKEGFSSESLRFYTPLFVEEVEGYIQTSSDFRSDTGICNIYSVMSEITLYSAARSLQGQEIRDLLNSTFANLYRHLDDGFAPINFMFPWAPIPRNRRRDHAQKKMAALYLDIIRERRRTGNKDGTQDMLWTLMDSNYKDGTPVPDIEIAHLMIALLMGGQHNSAATGTWMILELAHRPHLIQELYKEQTRVLNGDPLTYEHMSRLPLHNQIIHETLRIHSPIHSILRKVKSPMQIPDTDTIVPAGHILLAAPGYLARHPHYFPDPENWDPHRWGSNASDSPTTPPSHQPSNNNLTNLKDKSALTSPYLPFGAGRHRCVGEQYAYTQLISILATLVRIMEWEQVDPKAEVLGTDYSVSFLFSLRERLGP
ncbi:putative cytochrome p450 51 [Phaeomoniella chlamydospora]|uniref:Putative cytochrome p450 51 n=1 Tax=Phaeomoniella chlamydospora TaxID=158046 RepID=A0A0G2GWQ5_PHACM|nr:putative cytochrome p450 51 [Phaeomoniella chlamydospora]